MFLVLSQIEHSYTIIPHDNVQGVGRAATAVHGDFLTRIIPPFPEASDDTG